MSPSTYPYHSGFKALGPSVPDRRELRSTFWIFRLPAKFCERPDLGERGKRVMLLLFTGGWIPPRRHRCICHRWVQIPDFLRCRRGPEESPAAPRTGPVAQALSKLFWIFGDSLSFTKEEARRILHSSQPLVQQAHYKTVEIPSKVAFEKKHIKKILLRWKNFLKYSW